MCKNWILGIAMQYWEPFNSLQIKVFVWAILETTSMHANKWLILNSIISVW